MQDGCGSFGRGFGVLAARAVILTGFLWCAIASAGPASVSTGPATRGALATADAFVDAISRGDRAAARALLLTDLVIFESGGAERSADEYSEHHLPADIEFMAGMKREIQSRQVGGDGTTGWVATKARIRGQYQGKSVDLDSTETVILTLTTAGWRIAHMHWSSSAHRAPLPAP